MTLYSHNTHMESNNCDRKCEQSSRPILWGSMLDIDHDLMACMTKNKSNRDMIGGLRSQFLCSGKVALGTTNFAQEIC